MSKSFIIWCFIGFFWSGPVYALTRGHETRLLRHRVQFWIDVYSRYSSNQVLIHDLDNPFVVFKVIDFSYVYNKPGSKASRKRLIKNTISRVRSDYRKRATKVWQGLCKGQEEGKWQQKKLARSYRFYLGQDAIDRQCVSRKTVRVRGQRGMKEDFRRAIKRSGRYLTKMELVFEKFNVPFELTRLAFVESMFNSQAISFVGALGVWQFMKETGKRYLHINRFIDERRSPIKSTFAAAKLLRYNYEHTRSWPLAVTAYNHGLNGMMRAVKRLQTRDIGSVIGGYKSNSFGFASKNFYAEFSAANYVYNRRQQLFEKLIFEPSDRFKLVTISKSVTAKHFMRLCRIDRQTFKSLNPDILPIAYRQGYRLPKDFIVLIPRDKIRHYRQNYLLN